MRLASLLLIGVLLTSFNAYAGKIAGIETVNEGYLDENHNGDVVVEGKVYHAPIVSKNILLLQRAIKGDTESKEMLLDGKEKVLIFIGDTQCLWVELTKDGVKVYKPEKR